MNIIILDLDKTLIHSIRLSDNQYFDKQESYGQNGTLLDSGYITFKRPNADTFIRWCFRKFDRVIIWSAGTTEYVEEILNKMFNQFVFDIVLTRYHCMGDRLKDFNNPLIIKVLRAYKIDICKANNLCFVDDKVHRIQNNRDIKLVQIEPFESKWADVIQNNKKRKRPIREQDNSLLDVRKILIV